MDCIFKSNTLRGTWLIDKLGLPNPTKSIKERERYIQIVVPIAVFLAAVPFGVIYGFNVWLLPLSLSLYGQDATYSLRNGVVLYSFSAILPATAFFVLTLPKQLLTMSTGLLQLIATILFLVMSILSGICIHFKSDIGLFFTQLLLSGIPGATGSLVTVIIAVTWYREVKRPAVGAGYYGFFCGLWPVLFSFWGSALAEVDIESSMYIAGGINFILQLPAAFLLRSANELPLESNANIILSADNEGSTGGETDAATMYESINESLRDSTAASSDRSGEDIPKKDTEELEDNLLPKEESTNKAGFAEAQVPTLSQQEINKTFQTWIQFFVWMTAFIPGFALKYTVSPVMSAVFGASLLLQTLSSFAFLFVYAISRLIVGFIIGPVLTVKTMLTFVTILSPICFFCIGVLVKKGGDETWRLVLYIVLNCIIAFTLGTKKVLISPVNLSLWGVNNLGTLVGRTMASLCCGAVIGPIIIWAGLSAPGDIYIDDTLNTSAQQQAELKSFVGGALLILGGVASVACIGFLFLVKPHEKHVL